MKTRGRESIYRDQILELAKNPEYTNKTGQYSGILMRARIAREVGCSEATIDYWIDPNEKPRVLKSSTEKRKLRRKTASPEMLTVIYKNDKDPESIFNLESMEKIMDNKQVDLLFHESA
ncbi:MAG: hypothetical protein KJ697_04430 [Nanoarchaeota archaeon]|nr:hypothetical protein [Nanoarchaeota archaeon]MBU4124224.1 hypothetical protein [Nanoarchaeota archaeon]